MKLQTFVPYDSALIGLNNFYHVIGDTGFYINSDCIMTPRKIITKGKQYLLASTPPQGSETTVHKIRLLDGFFYKGFVYLFVIDLNSERVYIVDMCMECPDGKCTWVLYDMKDYNKHKDYTAIKSYCQKGNENKQKTAANRNSRKLNDDLLEFDF